MIFFFYSLINGKDLFERGGLAGISLAGISGMLLLYVRIDYLTERIQRGDNNLDSSAFKSYQG